MLFLILIFLAIALFASLLGYKKIASEASLTAIFLFWDLLNNVHR